MHGAESLEAAHEASLVLGGERREASHNNDVARLGPVVASPIMRLFFALLTATPRRGVSLP